MKPKVKCELFRVKACFLVPSSSWVLTWRKGIGSSLGSLLCARVLSCVQLCDPVGCNPPGSSVHEIFRARILKWVAISSSRGSSWPRDWTCISWTRVSGISLIGRQILYHWATWEALGCLLQRQKFHSWKLLLYNLITSQRLHSQLSLHWGLDFNIWILGGTNIQPIAIINDLTEINIFVREFYEQLHANK